MPKSHGAHKHSKKDSSSSSSCSSSSSSEELECYSNEVKEMDVKCSKKKHNKHHKHHHKHSDSSSSSSSSSSSECKPKFKLCDIYCYFKNRLLEDEQLMIAGSDAYTNGINERVDLIPQYNTLNFDRPLLKYNIDNMVLDAPYYVRKDGVYIIFFSMNTDNAAQLTLFINGVVSPLTSVGTNAGAGQLLSRHIISLKADDVVVIRNYISTSIMVTSRLYSGGVLPGANSTICIVKVASLNPPVVDYCNEDKFMDCLSHKKKKLFKKLYELLVCDKNLMVKGYNIHGEFYTTTSQTVAVGSPIVFTNSQNVSGLLWNSADQVTIIEDGVYKLFFMINTGTPGQFSLALNGVPITTTVEGSNQGSGQINFRTLLELVKNDVITVINNISASGNITSTQNNGGIQNNINTILSIFKIAPLSKPEICHVDCKLVKQFECYYTLFRDFLLYQKCLMLTGSSSYLGVSRAEAETVQVNNEFNWTTEIVKHNISYRQGYNTITINESGLYDVFGDVLTNEASQMAFTVNGVVLSSGIFGRDSGAIRLLLRALIQLNKGDQLAIINNNSNIGSLTIPENPGGTFIGQSATLMLFLLSKECEPCEKPCEPCEKPCEKHHDKHHDKPCEKPCEKPCDKPKHGK
jgi:hypothetical protein